MITSDSVMLFQENCPINEQAGDGTTCGRCWYYLTGMVCPRHGDVSSAVKRYVETGCLTLENSQEVE